VAYRIAIASSDGVHIDRRFRDADQFRIVEVDDAGNYEVIELRSCPQDDVKQVLWTEENPERTPEGAENGCGVGCHRDGRIPDCGGENSPKVQLVSDCRCLLCTQIGFRILKQLSKKAISPFEIEGSIEDALEKIIKYYDRLDRHQPLRGFAQHQES
jgi:predicted Fe-Mo cluster-binding NifX family protein